MSESAVDVAGVSMVFNQGRPNQVRATDDIDEEDVIRFDQGLLEAFEMIRKSSEIIRRPSGCVSTSTARRSRTPSPRT